MGAPIIPKFTLDEVKLLTLNLLISDHFNTYFSTRQVCDKIISDKFKIPERYLFTESEYSELQKFTKKQMNHVIRFLKSNEYILKASNRFWQIVDKEEIKKDKLMLDE